MSPRVKKAECPLGTSFRLKPSSERWFSSIFGGVLSQEEEIEEKMVANISNPYPRSPVVTLLTISLIRESVYVPHGTCFSP